MTPTPENIDALLRRLPADSLSHALVTLLNGCPEDEWDAALREKTASLVEKEVNHLSNA